MFYSYEITITFLYLLLGVIWGRLPFEEKWHVQRYIAAFLTYWVIPIVMIYNIARPQTDVFWVIIFMTMAMIILLSIALYWTRDKIQTLCFAYSNIGWLGIPLAIAFWGDAVASVLIGIYIANAIVGNLACTLFFQEQQKSFWWFFISPPILSLVIGLCLMPFFTLIHWPFGLLYDYAKFLLGFLGMLILGIAMAKHKITWLQLKSAFKQNILRFFAFGFFISLFVAWGAFMNIPLIFDHSYAFYMIGLLPPAANIVILELRYLKTEKSAPIIASSTIVSFFMLFFYMMITKLII